MSPARALLILCLTLTTDLCLADGQPVSFLAMTSEVPAAWIASEPRGDMRLLQVTVPAADETGAAELVVYDFGPGQGGSLEANVSRWTSQFSSDDGPVEPVITPLTGNVAATLVARTGRYARGVGVGPVGDALPNRTLLAGVVETPRANLYPQFYGPADLVAKHKAEFVGFITGISQVPSPLGGSDSGSLSAIDSSRGALRCPPAHHRPLLAEYRVGGDVRSRFDKSARSYFSTTGAAPKVASAPHRATSRLCLLRGNRNRGNPP